MTLRSGDLPRRKGPRLSIVMLALWIGAAAHPEVGAPASAPPYHDYDYIIIGAGSAGLQMGLFMQRDGAKYVIFEKAHDAGAFWRLYPVTGELISANSNAAIERFDQHSLLAAPIKFRNVSRRFFPQRRDFQTYLNKIAATLNVMYATEVTQLLPGPCVLLANGERKCAAHRVFVGTGLEPRRWPELEMAGSIPYERFNVSAVD